ncbi:MAG: hypothetical protein PHO08_05640 [Methylococcales bacterium]|nr:hypothetical protein [Methylococcales bacterium]MDD5632841.1 hypothetical protein [Methylococcales bacterium]
MNKYKKTDGFVKKFIQVVGLGIALLVMSLLASGIFFTGLVAHSAGGALNPTVHK